MVRLKCAKCDYLWVRKMNLSRGQLIRCPNCGMVLGKLSKPINPYIPVEYRIEKAIDEYAR